MAGSAQSLRVTRWGVLGTGLTASRFAQDLRITAGARLSAVASRTRARAEAAAAAMGADLALEGEAALFGSPDVDVVYIATPNHRHHADCLAALAAGKHVLCEKPLAMTSGQAREIAAAAAAANRFCMEALWTHFIPAVIEAERRIAQGLIGTPHVLVSGFGAPSRATADASPMPNGGALLDRGVYPISLALRLFGSPTSVHGHVLAGSGGADLTASASLGFEGGRSALIGASLVDLLENCSVIGGDGGSITLNDVPCPTTLSLRCTGVVPPSLAPSGLKGRLRETVRTAVRGSKLLTQLRAQALAHAEAIPCRGFGYVHEIEHVQACLQAGRLQSEVHALGRSIETLKVIEAIVGEGKL